MGNYNYPRKGKRERLLESLSLGSRKCDECDSFSLCLDLGNSSIVTCKHCKGEWSVSKDKKTLVRQTFDNIKPLYMEEGF